MTEVMKIRTDQTSLRRRRSDTHGHDRPGHFVRCEMSRRWKSFWPARAVGGNQGRKASTTPLRRHEGETPRHRQEPDCQPGQCGFLPIGRPTRGSPPRSTRCFPEFGLSYRFPHRKRTGRDQVFLHRLSHRRGYLETTTLESSADTSGAKNPIPGDGVCRHLSATLHP